MEARCERQLEGTWGDVVTTPNQPRPDDKAFVVDDPDPYGLGQNYNQGWTEESVDQEIEGQAREILEEAASGFNIWKQQGGATLAAAADGQLNYNNALSLLNDVSGYASAWMSHNWLVPLNSWVVLPFNRQIGPVKGATVDDQKYDGSICIKKRGLWRVDLHTTVQGFTTYITPSPIPPYFIPYYGPIVPQYQIQVMSANDALHTGKLYGTTSSATNTVMQQSEVDHPHSSAFTHTFVVDIPDEDDPSQWFYVRASMRYTNATGLGIPAEAHCKAFGGTSRAALIATRWSRDVVAPIPQDDVPDGGSL